MNGSRRRLLCWRMSLPANRIPLRPDVRKANDRDFFENLRSKSDNIGPEPRFALYGPALHFLSEKATCALNLNTDLRQSPSSASAWQHGLALSGGLGNTPKILND